MNDYDLSGYQYELNKQTVLIYTISEKEYLVLITSSVK